MLDPDALIREGIATGNAKKISLGRALKAKQEKKQEEPKSPIILDTSVPPIPERKGSGPVRGLVNTWKDDLSQSKELLQSSIKKRSKGNNLYGESIERTRESQLIETQCRLCHDKVKVPQYLLRKDSDTGKIYYECDSCAGDYIGKHAKNDLQIKVKNE